jgi:CRP-like cAMP-binding protein
MEANHHEAIRLFLNRLLLRSELDERECDAVLSLRGRSEVIEAHRDIVVPGQKVTTSCLIASGLAARFDQMRDGGRQIDAFHLPGDMCDLHSVPISTSAWGLQALSATSILMIAHADLRHLAATYPNLGLSFWRDTIVDGSVMSKWVGNLGRRDSPARIAHLLCEMGMRMELADLGKRTDYPLLATQGQLADATGMTVVHMNRSLKVLREAGVSFVRKRVTIADWNQLVEIADFDPRYLMLEKNAPK